MKRPRDDAITIVVVLVTESTAEVQFEHRVRREDTVQKFKKDMEPHIHMPISSQRLIYKGESWDSPGTTMQGVLGGNLFDSGTCGTKVFLCRHCPDNNSLRKDSRDNSDSSDHAVGEMKDENEDKNDFDHQYENVEEEGSSKCGDDDDLDHQAPPSAMRATSSSSASCTASTNSSTTTTPGSRCNQNSFRRPPAGRQCNQNCLGGETKTQASLRCASNAVNDSYYAYEMALARHNLRIEKCRGDGNCFFRTVSHQVYVNLLLISLVLQYHCTT
jgi:hypothetical protein